MPGLPELRTLHRSLRPLIGRTIGRAGVPGVAARVCRARGREAEGVWAARGRPNVIATLRGEGGGRRLLLNGHLDTVAAEGMDRPFVAVERVGRLSGRGAGRR